MYATPEFIHYGTVAFAVGFTSISVGIGEALASMAALDAINTQPHARGDIARTAIIGMALVETAAILGIVVAIMLLFSPQPLEPNFYANLSELGIAFAICITGFVSGIVSALPTRAACLAIARQPFFSQQITRLMLVTQSLLQGPMIFSFIIALVISYQSASATTLGDSLRLMASGLCIGLGSIGPSIGLAVFAQSACRGLGINPQAYTKILSFSIISQTIIETPIIFSFVIAMTLLIMTSTNNISSIEGIAFLAASLCTGLGMTGPGISSGKTAAAACKQITHNADTYSMLSRVSLFAQGLIETCAIYAVLISFLLIFVK
jgi:F0F1-type ATP synthase membrane subunit c/vacuolar-type H+-ATPase subunit K